MCSESEHLTVLVLLFLCLTESLNVEFVCSVLVVADQLLITRLKEMCEVVITENCMFYLSYPPFIYPSYFTLLLSFTSSFHLDILLHKCHVKKTGLIDLKVYKQQIEYADVQKLFLKLSRHWTASHRNQILV